MATKKKGKIKVTNFTGTVKGVNVMEGEKSIGSIAKVHVPKKGNFADSTLFITGKSGDVRFHHTRTQANRRLPRLTKIAPKLR